MNLILNFCLYFFSSITLVISFAIVYMKITPLNEIELIKEGKIAPSLSFGGVILGFSIPLYSTIIHSISFLDMLKWALIASVIQIVAFLFIRKILFKNVEEDLKNNNIAIGFLMFIISVSIGILNASSISY